MRKEWKVHFTKRSYLVQACSRLSPRRVFGRAFCNGMKGTFSKEDFPKHFTKNWSEVTCGHCVAVLKATIKRHREKAQDNEKDLMNVLEDML